MAQKDKRDKRIKVQKSKEKKDTNHDSRITNHESRITSHESRITNHESRITNHDSIAIIGGGISGLATAFYIKHFKPDVKITLFEKEEFLGGKMHTAKKDGYLIEEGSNGFLSNKPDTLELVKLSGCEDILLKSSDEARKRFIYDKKLEVLPESAKAFLTTPLLSFKGKLRVLYEPFAKPKKDDSDESLQSFGYRRVGKEMTDVFLDAMVAGIYASTPQKISAPAAFPLVVNLEKEYGSLFKGMFAKKKKEAGPGGVLMSFKGGVSSFIEKLSRNLDINIIKSADIKSLKKDENGFIVIGENLKMRFDKVVLSTPAYKSADIVKELSQKLSQELYGIEYSPISIVGVGYNNLSHPLKGFGLLATTRAKKSVLGVLWDSSIFDDRAEGSKKLLRAMIGGQRSPLLGLADEDKLVEYAIEGIKETMGIDLKPDMIYVKQHIKGIPNYAVGHIKRVDSIFDIAKNIKGLYLNSNAYRGIGLNDCVSNAKKCAKEVVEEL